MVDAQRGPASPPPLEDGGGDAESHTSPTEAVNPRTAGIDRAGPAEIVRLIQAEDRLVPTAVQAEGAVIAALIEEVTGRLRGGGRLIYVGAGTSGRLGVLDAAECPPTFGTEPGTVIGLIAGGPGALVRSREGAEDDREAGIADVRAIDVGPRDFVLGIATSGTTPYVRAAVLEAAARGAGTGFLSCSPPPEDVRRAAAHVITPIVGPEVVAGSTRMKAGTATKLVLNTLSTGVMIGLGKVYGNLMVDLRAGSRKLVRRSLSILHRVCGLQAREARPLLVAAGGSVKTAIAMHELGASRAMAERLLDACEGRLADVVERFAGAEHLPYYACYPADVEPAEISRLLEELARGPERLRAACEAHAGRDERSPPRGWSPAQHLAHLLQAEREAYRPRLERLIETAQAPGGPGSPPAFEDWPPDPDPPVRGKSVPELLLEVAAERGRTTDLLAEAPAAAWSAAGTLDGDRIALHQLVRAVTQHDRAHADRIRERIHPDLLA